MKEKNMNDLGDSMMKGMQEALAFGEGKIQNCIVHVPENINEFRMRKKRHMTALKLLQKHAVTSKLKQLQTLIDEGENSGELVTWSADDFLKRIQDKKKSHD